MRVLRFFLFLFCTTLMLFSGLWFIRSAQPVKPSSTLTAAHPKPSPTQGQPSAPPAFAYLKPPQVPQSVAQLRQAASEKPAAGPFWLRGRVTSPEHVPIETFDVQLFKTYEPFLSPLQSEHIVNRAGEFEIQSPQRGPLDVVVHATGFIRDLSPQVELAASRADAGVEQIILVPAGRIRGTVVDDSGTPVSAVEVKLGITLEFDEELDPEAATGSNEGGANPSDLTDAEGRFELRQLPQGRYNLYAEREGYFPASETVALRSGQVLEDVRLTLSVHGGTVVVKVKDSGGAPVMNRLIRLDETPFQGLTDATGSWRQADLPPGSYRVLLSADESNGRLVSAAQWSDVVVEAAKEAAVVFQVEEAITVSGEVLRGNEGVAGIEVIAGQARSPSKEATLSAGTYALGSATTDEQGRFVLDGLPPGDYTLAAVSKDEQQAGEVRFTLRAGDRYRRVQIQLGSAVLEGSVTDEASGKAVPRAIVNLFSVPPDWDVHDEGDTYPVLVKLETSTDGQGKYRFEGLSEGQYLLDVSATSYGSLLDQPVSVDKTNNRFDVQMQRSSQLVVRVRDAAQLPVHGATLMITQTARPDSIRASATNADGLVHLEDLAPGNYEAVLAVGDLAQPADRTTLNLSAGQIARWNITVPVQPVASQAPAEAAAPQ